MSKAVLISIQPQWCELIASGKKTVELRKNRPRLNPPFKCYIYCTQGDLSYSVNGVRHNLCGGRVVIGEFICDAFYPYCNARPAFVNDPQEIERQSCLPRAEVWKYEQRGDPIGWHISKLVMYDHSRHLYEFRKACENDLYCESCAMFCNYYGICRNPALKIIHPPQSWCYVAELEEGAANGI